MNRVKKILHALLFPHLLVSAILLPFTAVFLIHSLTQPDHESSVAVVSYVLAAYTLTIWCVRIPKLIRKSQSFRYENKYARMWSEDVRLRTKISLYGSCFINTVYAIFQFCLGLYHGSFWYDSMAGYYVSLALMRFFLVSHTWRYRIGENLREELRKYRICGWVFLFMNLAVTLMIFFMVYWNRTFRHHEITTIAMAAYTFIAFSMAVTNMIRYRKYRSPVVSASKAISLAAACVSMLTLEATMLTTFGGETMGLLTRRLFLGLSGGVISIVIIVMAVCMIVRSSRAMKEIERNI